MEGKKVWVNMALYRDNKWDRKTSELPYMKYSAVIPSMPVETFFRNAHIARSIWLSVNIECSDRPIHSWNFDLTVLSVSLWNWSSGVSLQLIVDL